MSFLDSFGARYVLKAAAIAALLSAFAAFAYSIGVLLNGIVAESPPWLATGAFLLPNNLSTCLSAVMTAKIAKWVYDTHAEKLKMVAFG